MFVIFNPAVPTISRYVSSGSFEYSITSDGYRTGRVLEPSLSFVHSSGRSFERMACFLVVGASSDPAGGSLGAGGSVGCSSCPGILVVWFGLVWCGLVINC